jgi:L,D-peptidoglycan transpeptidase YkuD (ErfK/YbiS/YcfS/YnhG family)
MASTICHWSSSKHREKKNLSHQGLLTSEVGRVAVVKTGNGEIEKRGFHEAVWKNGRGKKKKKNQGATPSGSSSRRGIMRRVRAEISYLEVVTLDGLGMQRCL